jgi:hypothetical protein
MKQWNDITMNADRWSIEDIEYYVAEQLDIDAEDLERCPQSVYRALIVYFYERLD